MAWGGGPVIRFIFSIIVLTFLIPTPGHTAHSFQIALVNPPRVLWERPITTTHQFTLVHRNSIYGVFVWEALQIDSEGRLWLSEIKTDSPAVLEYYGIEASQNSWIKLDRKIDALKIRGTSFGEFCLDFNQDKINLSQRVPDGTLVEIRTRKIPEE
jgi:hypothetical protein